MVAFVEMWLSLMPVFTRATLKTIWALRMPAERWLSRVNSLTLLLVFHYWFISVKAHQRSKIISRYYYFLWKVLLSFCGLRLSVFQIESFLSVTLAWCKRVQTGYLLEFLNEMLAFFENNKKLCKLNGSRTKGIFFCFWKHLSHVALIARSQESA